jgi:hypothetical protein
MSWEKERDLGNTREKVRRGEKDNNNNNKKQFNLLSQ